MDAEDEPMPITACWLSWLAVAASDRAKDQAEVVRLLGLTEVRPTTWSAGVELVDEVAHSGDDRFSTVVVTPVLDGWVLVFGAWLGLPYPAATDRVTDLCQQLSARFGKAQAYFHSAQNDGEAWLIAEQGTVLRRWIAEYPEAALGEPSGVERELLDAAGITGKPEDLDPDDDLASEWQATFGDCWATTVAAEHSLDPATIGPSTPAAGTVLIAGTRDECDRGLEPDRELASPARAAERRPARPNDEPWWHELWIPFGDAGAGLQVIDLRPGPHHGRVGLAPTSNPADFTNAWSSLGAYLTAVADALDQGGTVGVWHPRIDEDKTLWWDLTEKAS